MVSPSRTDHSPTIVLLFLLCLLLYQETVQYGWHLDDPPNILLNQLLHITDLQPATLIQTFFAHPVSPGTLFRPVANLSFALNWFIGQDSAFGYHLMNIGIHFSIAAMLYLCCLLLLKTPTGKTIPKSQHSSIALLTAVLWLLAPIHTQAVTYIVQRMAQLATLFTIITIFFYLLCRLSEQRKQQILYSILLLFSAILAIGSKENAILLPGSILLVEAIFWPHESSLATILQENRKKNILFTVISITACAYLLSRYGTGIFNYEHRNFSLLERVLSEPRILLFYLLQIFQPSTALLSIEHDVELSTSLFTPWTTLPAILICTGLILTALLRIRRNPFLSFAILFYFLNHVVESTVIHLELIFEHRNYLPSLFLFFPVAVFIVNMVSRPNKRWSKQIIKFSIVTACTLFMIQSGVATYSRNRTWKNDAMLWQDAVHKAPRSGRARLNLASSFLTDKQYDKAFELCEQAKELTGATRNKLIPIALGIQGDIAYAQSDYKLAVSRFQAALSLRPDYIDVLYKLIAVLNEQKQYDKALTLTDDGYQKTGQANFLLLKGALLLRINRPKESLQAYQAAGRALQKRPTSLTLEGKGKALSMLGYYEQADRVFSWAVKSNPDVLLLLMENSLRAGEPDKARSEMNQLLQIIPFERLLQTLSTAQTDAYQIPFNNTLLRQLLLEVTENIALQSLAPAPGS